jgi:hypothetical protein
MKNNQAMENKKSTKTKNPPTVSSSFLWNNTGTGPTIRFARRCGTRECGVENVARELQPPPPKTKKETEESIGVVKNSQGIWKQAVINSSPHVVQAIIAASSSDKKSATGMRQIDFLALAKSGLGRKRKNPELPEPTFRIEDLLVVMELEQKKLIKDENGEEKISVESLGVFWKNGSEDMLVDKDGSYGKVDFDLENNLGLV